PRAPSPGVGQAAPSTTAPAGEASPRSYGWCARRRRTRPGDGRVRFGMTIDAQHIDEPGLVVLDITAANEETAHAVMAELEQW
ncbi:DUF6207 family protein, partial [Streptomyces atratus]|uniref:DUF6207 family protein n=1 Tax=Streptomyces atratus TaxID=1893 RepID=UPI003682266F